MTKIKLCGEVPISSKDYLFFRDGQTLKIIEKFVKKTNFLWCLKVTTETSQQHVSGRCRGGVIIHIHTHKYIAHDSCNCISTHMITQHTHTREWTQQNHENTHKYTYKKREFWRHGTLKWSRITNERRHEQQSRGWRCTQLHKVSNQEVLCSSSTSKAILTHRKMGDPFIFDQGWVF